MLYVVIRKYKIQKKNNKILTTSPLPCEELCQNENALKQNTFNSNTQEIG